MDPATLASTAIGLLGPLLGKVGEGGLARIGESITDKALEPLSRLYTGVKNRLQGDPYGKAVLAGAEERPGSQARLGALESTLAELLTADPGFATLIEGLVTEAKAAGATHINDSGAVAGGDVNIRGTYAAGRDMHIGSSE
jgi:hypothetical protein